MKNIDLAVTINELKQTNVQNWNNAKVAIVNPFTLISSFVINFISISWIYITRRCFKRQVLAAANVLYYCIGLFWFLRANQASPVKTYPTTRKKLDNQTHNDLQITMKLPKNCRKRSFKKTHFIFNTLKLLTLKFQFWKNFWGASANPASEHQEWWGWVIELNWHNNRNFSKIGGSTVLATKPL